jgi:hypothetical protein
MPRFKDMLRVQTLTGDPISAGGVTVTPQSQAIALRWPKGGWVWNRPLAVLVEREGETERIPIVNVTRIAQLGLYAFVIAFALRARKRYVRNRRKGNGSEQ